MPDCISDLDTALACIATLQSQAAAHGISLREPPPQPTTCCGRGCNGCVWEAYYGAVQFWQEDAVIALSPRTAA